MSTAPRTPAGGINSTRNRKHVKRRKNGEHSQRPQTRRENEKTGNRLPAHSAFPARELGRRVPLEHTYTKYYQNTRTEPQARRFSHGNTLRVGGCECVRVCAAVIGCVGMAWNRPGHRTKRNSARQGKGGRINGSKKVGTPQKPPSSIPPPRRPPPDGAEGRLSPHEPPAPPPRPPGPPER